MQRFYVTVPPTSSSYEDVFLAFELVSVRSKDDFWELMGSVFPGGCHWTNSGPNYYFEYERDDPARPLNRMLEQKPVFYRAEYEMHKADWECEEIMRYVTCCVTRSRGSLLQLYYAATWFFLTRFGLLVHGNSKERELLSREREDDDILTFSISEACRWSEPGPNATVFCGALKPSELLDRSVGRRASFVFPEDAIEYRDGSFRVTVFLIDFPNPIESVITAEELFDRLARHGPSPAYQRIENDH